MALTRRDLLGLGAIATIGAGSGLGWRLAEGLIAGGADALGPADGEGLRLARGFRARVIGRSGELVAGSAHRWHVAPDGGACFATPDGGWVYVSNSEVANGGGGVSAVRFAPSGAIVDAYVIASGTHRNCSGGATSWGTWLTCEEVADGRVLECHPTRPGDAIPRPLLGSFRHEAVAEDRSSGIIYETEDAPEGRLYRYLPSRRGDLVHGRLEAAKVIGSRVTWVEVAPDEPARSTATTSFAGGEGIAIDGPTMFVTTKGDDRIWELGLADGSIRVFYDGAATPSALSGVDQIVVHPTTRKLFVAEDGGNVELVEITFDRRGRLASIAPFLRFEGHTGSEVTGPAFTADGRRLYVSSQRGRDGKTGLTVEVTGPFQSWPEVATVSGRWRAE